MNCLFLRRGYPQKMVDITVTGSGNSSDCYIEISGAKIINAGEYTVKAGDVVIFGVYGSSKYKGTVTIDGTTVLTATSSAVYNWDVPTDINAAAVSLSYTSIASRRHGVIAVTTS